MMTDASSPVLLLDGLMGSGEHIGNLKQLDEPSYEINVCSETCKFALFSRVFDAPNKITYRGTRRLHGHAGSTTMTPLTFAKINYHTNHSLYAAVWKTAIWDPEKGDFMANGVIIKGAVGMRIRMEMMIHKLREDIRKCTR